MRKRLVTQLAHRRQIDIVVVAAEPDHEGHVGLGIWSNEVRQPMQVEAGFAKRLTVVTDVQHCSLEASVVRSQQVDHARQEMIRVQNRVVISVADLFLRADVQLIGFAGGREDAELGRVALVVGGSMTSQLMKDDQDETQVFSFSGGGLF